ncbi:glycoside hydrolase [Lophiotrema nucula]|uniref:Glycoside hydrolase n=1 Tax=Lophiotrema nucula TaxID=690887 RepID=A0A6A5ZM14_9PLEO|nr:glycoside hydrolase [Lophiotrema nucula]
MLSIVTLSLILTATHTVWAHGWIDVWTISGQNYTGFNPTTAPWVPDQGTIAWPAWNTDTGPVYSKNVNSPDIICSINATNSKTYATPIAAGHTLSFHWTVWPDSHHGPIISYLAACNGDCTKVDKQQLKWFKIAEMGQASYGEGSGKAGTWADDKLRSAGGAWSVTIPSSIKAGNYVLRNEILALHSAYDVGAAQLYPQCANINITGGGNATPSGVVGTSLYSVNDSGIHYNIYNDEAKPVYQIPGPELCA